MLKGLFKKEVKVEKREIRISKTVPRPEVDDYEHISSDKKKEIIDRMRNSENGRIDLLFLQSVIDKALGPKGEEYLDRLIDLNNEFPSRRSKTGTQIYE